MADRPLYEVRFSPEEERNRDALWAVLVRDSLQAWVPEASTVLDFGAGSGNFLRHVRAARKIAVERDEFTPPDGCEKVVSRDGALTSVADASVDRVLASNVFEHLASPEALLAALREIRRVLRPDGRLLVLGPNWRYAWREYWDFLDHRLALSDVTLAEALAVSGFEVELMKPRFLPYTTKGNRLASPALLGLYLRLPFLHPLFGKQMFAVARVARG